MTRSVEGRALGMLNKGRRGPVRPILMHLRRGALSSKQPRHRLDAQPRQGGVRMKNAALEAES
jgi:hypothetical protein